MNGQHQELSVANQTRQGPYTSSEVCVLPELVLLSLMLWFGPSVTLLRGIIDKI